MVARDADALADEVRPAGGDAVDARARLADELVAHLRDGEQHDRVTAPSATSPSVAFRPHATATATTMPAASATKLDCENEMSRPSHVATTTA